MVGNQNYGGPPPQQATQPQQQPSALGQVAPPGPGTRMVVLNPQQTAIVTQGLNQLLAHNAAPLFPGEMLVGWQLRVLQGGQLGVEVFLRRAQPGMAPQPQQQTGGPNG